MVQDLHTYELNADRTNQPMPISIDWWPLPAYSRQLKQLAHSWPDARHLPSLYQLGPCLYEVHLARQMIQPFPQIAVASCSGEPVGMLASHLDTVHEQLYIAATAIHPRYADSADGTLAVVQPLVEAAVDVSLTYGWHGWIAYDFEQAPRQQLLTLGFRAEPPFYYRKMGYFS